LLLLTLSLPACNCIDLSTLREVACEGDGGCSSDKTCCSDKKCRATCSDGVGGGGGGGVGGGGGGVGGGAGGGGGTVACDINSCPTGCCQGPFCQTSPSFSFCGGDGGACMSCSLDTADQCFNGACSCGTNPACGPGQRCEGAKCVCNTTSCANGCCVDGGCIGYAAQSTAQCGTLGTSCKACAGGTTDTCTQGACSCGAGAACAAGQFCAPDAGAPATCACSSGSCDGGCCLGANCLSPGQTDAGFVVCRGGDAGSCLQCPPGLADRCLGSQCRCGTGPACAVGSRCNGNNCTCDITTCPNGCCDGNNKCRAVDLNFCRGGASAQCSTCLGSDNCAQGPNGCRCGSGPSCGNGELCENGQCICNPTLCTSGSCCDPTTNRCTSPLSALSCGLGGTCEACTTPAQCGASGICSSCSSSCDTCCLGDTCVGRDVNDGGTFPNCARLTTGLGRACMVCDPVKSDRCGSQGCSCGPTAIPCGEAEICNQGQCECDPTTCKGCCQSTGGGSSRCVGTISTTACAPARDGGGTADKCDVCNPFGFAYADSCNPAGDCMCGDAGACDAGFRCMNGQCFNP
jgi:hypothetical protein